MANRVVPTAPDADNPAGGRTLGLQRLARRCPQIPCRHGPSRAHTRSRIYDCRLTLVARPIDQSLSSWGESIYAGLDPGSADERKALGVEQRFDRKIHVQVGPIEMMG